MKKLSGSASEVCRVPETLDSLHNKTIKSPEQDKTHVQGQNKTESTTFSFDCTTTTSPMSRADSYTFIIYCAF